jgi:hypothetical protein
VRHLHELQPVLAAGAHGGRGDGEDGGVALAVGACLVARAAVHQVLLLVAARPCAKRQSAAVRLAERLPVDVEGGRATLRTRQWARLHTLPQHWVFGGRQRREGATHTHTPVALLKTGEQIGTHACSRAGRIARC